MVRFAMLYCNAAQMKWNVTGSLQTFTPILLQKLVGQMPHLPHRVLRPCGEWDYKLSCLNCTRKALDRGRSSLSWLPSGNGRWFWRRKEAVKGRAVCRKESLKVGVEWAVVKRGTRALCPIQLLEAQLCWACKRVTRSWAIWLIHSFWRSMRPKSTSGLKLNSCYQQKQPKA